MTTAAITAITMPAIAPVDRPDDFALPSFLSSSSPEREPGGFIPVKNRLQYNQFVLSTSLV